MVNKKTDLEQLRGILKQFTPEIIQQATAERLEADYCRKSYKDFDDPGPEVEVGTDSRVSLEEISRMERVLVEPNFLPVHFLEEGAVLQRAVARIVRSSGSALGTGFLVSPSLFLTNNHVIEDEAFARTVGVQFNYQFDYEGNPQTIDEWSANPDSVFYTNASLDFTLVRLKARCSWIYPYPYRYRVFNPESETSEAFRAVSPQAGMGVVSQQAGLAAVTDYRDSLRVAVVRICRHAGESWGYLRLLDSIAYATVEHLNIIQHPQGRRKEVALQKNTISNIYTNRIRYTTDTEPGSSGSPVFNNAFDLVAIHHAAGEWDNVNGVWVSNEGMRIDKIVADLRSHYTGSTAGEEILAELGI